MAAPRRRAAPVTRATGRPAASVAVVVAHIEMGGLGLPQAADFPFPAAVQGLADGGALEPLRDEIPGGEGAEVAVQLPQPAALGVIHVLVAEAPPGIGLHRQQERLEALRFA